MCSLFAVKSIEVKGQKISKSKNLVDRLDDFDFSIFLADVL